MITIGDVEEAARRLEGVAHRTPLLRSRQVDEVVGAEVLFKCEQFQRTGSFKFRGAHNAIASLSDDERRCGVFAWSSGNHAQAVALAARESGTTATILMPDDAPPGKVAATEGYGAEILRYDRYAQDRTAVGTALATERGMTIIRPFDDERVMAGQGTVALEVLDEVEGVDVWVSPLGGGGLLSGCATVLAARSPGTRIIGVEPADGDDWVRSLAAGQITSVPVPRTIADGLQTEAPGQHTFPVVRDLVHDVTTVTDQQIVTAMRLLLERCKLVVEPSGAVGLAALLAGQVTARDQRVVVVLSGGNVDSRRLAELLSS